MYQACAAAAAARAAAAVGGESLLYSGVLALRLFYFFRTNAAPVQVTFASRVFIFTGGFHASGHGN